MFSPVVIIILSALKCVLYSPTFAYCCHPIRSGPPFFILMDIGQQKLFMCFPQFDSIGCWRHVQRQPRQRSMAANKKGLQMVQRGDHHQIFCVFATLIICVKTLLLVLESHLLRQQILPPFFEILWNKISSSRWRLLAG